MSDDEGAFVWGGGDGDDAAMSDDGSDDFVNPALGGGGDDYGDDNNFSWGGGGMGDSDDDGGYSNEDDEEGGRAGEPASSLDLLGSLLATSDMTGAMREPEPEPEPAAMVKKKNKKVRTTDPKAMMKAMKEAQNAADAGSPKPGGGGGDGAAPEGSFALRGGAAEYPTVVVDSAGSRWSIGLEGEIEPRSFSDGGSDLESCWLDLEDFMEDHCDGVVSSVDYAILFTVQALESSPEAARQLAEVALSDRFGFTRCSVVAQELLALYAHGVTTGLVLNLGQSAVTCVPVYGGALLYEGMRRMETTADVATSALIDMALGSVMSSPLDTRNGLFGQVILVGEKTLEWSDDQRIAFEKTLRRRFRQRFGGVLRGGRAKARADFVAQQAGDLNLHKGDDVTLRQLQGRWCEGEDGMGEVGVFPLEYVDLAPLQQRVAADYPCVLKQMYRDKYGTTKHRDEGARFSFGVELPPKEEREITIWIGGSVLAATEGWETLWCSSSAEVAEKCPVLGRDAGQFKPEQLLAPNSELGIVITSADDDNSLVLDPELVIDSWLEWMVDFESQLLQRREFWYFTNQPVSTESAGSRFEDLSKLEAVDRFGETMPEALRYNFYYGQRNAREKEMLDAKAWAKSCVQSAKDDILNSDTPKWHAVCAAQSKFAQPRTLEIRATVDGSGLTPAQKPLNLKWYAWGLGEPTEQDIKDHICTVWSLNRPGSVGKEVHLVDQGGGTVITSTRAVGDFLELSTDKPVTTAEKAAKAAIAAQDASDSDSDDDEISYDELPPNVQGMSILEQLQWKKEEVARRKAARAEKAGGGGVSNGAPKPERAGDASSAMLDDLLGGSGDAGAGAGSDEEMYSDEDEDGAGGLSSALFDNLMATAGGGDKSENTGETDFDGTGVEMPARPSARGNETSVMSMEDMMEAEAEEEGASSCSNRGDKSVREKDMFGMDDDDEEPPADRSMREKDMFGGDDSDEGDEANPASSARASRYQTTGLSMEDMMDAEDTPAPRGDTSVREKDLFGGGDSFDGDAPSAVGSSYDDDKPADASVMRASRNETSGMSMEDLMDAEEERASSSPTRPAETSGLSMEDMMEAEEEQERAAAPAAPPARQETTGLSMEDMMDADTANVSSPSSPSSEGKKKQKLFGKARKGVGVGGVAGDASSLLSSDAGATATVSDAPAAAEEPPESPTSMASAEFIDSEEEDDDELGAGMDLPPPPPDKPRRTESREMDFESMMGAVVSAKLPDDSDEEELDEYGMPIMGTSSNPLAAGGVEDDDFDGDGANDVLDGLDDLAEMMADEDPSMTSTHENPLADAGGGEASKAEQLLLKAKARRAAAAAAQPEEEAGYVDGDGDDVDHFDL